MVSAGWGWVFYDRVFKEFSIIYVLFNMILPRFSSPTRIGTYLVFSTYGHTGHSFGIGYSERWGQ